MLVAMVTLGAHWPKEGSLQTGVLEVVPLPCLWGQRHSHDVILSLDERSKDLNMQSGIA